MKTQKIFIGLAIGLLTIFAISYISLSVHDAQIYQKDTIWRDTPDGIHHAIDVYTPKKAAENVKPVVILVHGVGVSKEFFANFAVEFTVQGYLAVCPELRGHGRSQGALTGIGFEFPNELVIKLPDLTPLMNEINSTLAYLATRNDVDWNRISIIGHSMGGGTALLANLRFPNVFQSTVAIAPIPIWEINQTHPRNFLLIHGGLDEAFSLETEKDLFKRTLPDSALNDKGDFEFGVQYGNFEDGSARKFVFRPFDDHALEFVDPVVIIETRNWVNSAIKYGDNNAPLLYITRMGLIGGAMGGGIGAIVFMAIVFLKARPSKMRDSKGNIEASEPVATDRTKIMRTILVQNIPILLFGMGMGLLSFFVMYSTGYLITAAILAPLLGYMAGILLKWHLKRKSDRNRGLALKNPLQAIIGSDKKIILAELGYGAALGGFFSLVLYLTGGTFFVLTFPPFLRLGYAILFGVLIFGILLVDDLYFVEYTKPNPGKMRVLTNSIRQFLIQAPIIIATLLLELLFIENTFPLMFLAIILGLLFAINIIREIWHLHGTAVLFETLLFTIPVTGALVAMSSLVAV
jgi:dienelactone hydrolase